MLTSIMHTISERTWKTPVFVFALALGLFFRLWGTFEIPTYIEDEAIHVPSAINLGQYGTTAKMNWVHPQVSAEILYGTIAMLGDNPYGWRMSNVLMGTASVGLIYLIAELMFPGTAVSVIAASLLAFDPFHAYCSRTSFMEIPATFFFLLYCYLMLEYSERGRRTLPFAGIALGLAMATKAYFVFAVSLVALYAFYRAIHRKERTLVVCYDFGVALFMLPIAVAVLSYAPWFGRGYTFPEFIQMLRDAYRVLQSYTPETWANPWYVNAGGAPWSWFLKPWVQGFELFSDGENSRYLLQINNFPFRLLLAPSMAALAIIAWRERAVKEALVSLLVISCYLLILLVKRPMFGHSALAILPLAYLAVARAVVLLGKWSGRERILSASLIAASVLWGMYTFPLISARMVPRSLYLPLLSITHIFGGP